MQYRSRLRGECKVGDATTDRLYKQRGDPGYRLPPEQLAKMAALLNSVDNDVTEDRPAVVELLKRVRSVAAKE